MFDFISAKGLRLSREERRFRQKWVIWGPDGPTFEESGATVHAVDQHQNILINKIKIFGGPLPGMLLSENDIEEI